MFLCWQILWSALVDPRDAPPFAHSARHQILSFPCSFQQKKLRNDRLAHPLWELAPLHENPGSATGPCTPNEGKFESVILIKRDIVNNWKHNGVLHVQLSFVNVQLKMLGDLEIAMSLSLTANSAQKFFSQKQKWNRNEQNQLDKICWIFLLLNWHLLFYHKQRGISTCCFFKWWGFYAKLEMIKWYAIHFAGNRRLAKYFPLICFQGEQECIPVGWVPSAAVTVCWGVSAWGCILRGPVSQHALRQTPPPGKNSWHTLVKILPCRNFVADGNRVFLQ